MSIISERAARCFVHGYTRSLGNTQVVNNWRGERSTSMFLHGVLIAHLQHRTSTLWFSTRGWQTRVTISRLNAILDAIGTHALISGRGSYALLRQSGYADLLVFQSWNTVNLEYRPLRAVAMFSDERPPLGLTLEDHGRITELGEYLIAVANGSIGAPIQSVRVVSRRPPIGVRKAAVIPLPLP